MAQARGAGDAKTKKKLSGFFTGHVMRESAGQANGKAVADGPAATPRNLRALRTFAVENSPRAL